MKIRLINRNLEINNNRINVNNFKREITLIGISFNKKQMNFKEYIRLFLYLFMPYKWLNRRFEQNKI